MTADSDDLRAGRRLQELNALIAAEQDRLYTLAAALLGEGPAVEVVARACRQANREAVRTDVPLSRECLYRCLVRLCLSRLRWRVLGWAAAVRPEGGASAYLGRLPGKMSTAVALVDLAGLSYAEAARVLGCPAREMLRRLARGRSELSQLRLAAIRPAR